MLSLVLSVALKLQRDDEEGRLIGQLRRGDRVALRALYERLAGQALAVAIRVVSDRAEAEDVVQDAFVYIWQRCEQFDAARGTGRAWVLATVRNGHAEHA